MARRGHASTWAGAAPAIQSRAGSHTARKQNAPSAAVPRNPHSIAQEILAVMSGKDGLDALDDSDEDDGSEKDYYFSD